MNKFIRIKVCWRLNDKLRRLSQNQATNFLDNINIEQNELSVPALNTGALVKNVNKAI